MNEHVGRFVFIRAVRESASSHDNIELSDHPLNNALGLLILESVWGARKRDRAKILLSAGAKARLAPVVEKIGRGWIDKIATNTVVAFVPRGDKIPKIIISRDDTKNVIALIEISAGFRGGYTVQFEGGAEELVRVSAGAAWGESGWLLAYLPPGGKITIKHTGRLYGKPKYTVIINRGGEIVKVEPDDLSELEVDDSEDAAN